jgi:putative peptidoglycan binding protein
MNRRKVLTAALLSASMGLGAPAVFAQNAPSGGSATPGMPGQTVPQPGRQTQPTIPGQPAPGLPQTAPVPGQPGTIPERAQQPRASEGQSMAVSNEHIRQAQQALKAKGLNPGTDGKMDAKTQQALRDFQKQNNLPATGVLDEQTAAKLGISIDNGKSSGMSGSAGASSGSATGSVGGKSGSSSSSSKSVH